MMKMLGFTTRQAGQFSELTLRQMNYFDTTGLLSPSIQAAQGRGTRKLYSFQDLVALRLIAKLRKQGASLQAIRRAITCLHGLGQHELTGVVFAVTEDDVTLVAPDQPAVSLVKCPGQLCFLIGVDGLAHEVEEAIRRVG